MSKKTIFLLIAGLILSGSLFWFLSMNKKEMIQGTQNAQEVIKTSQDDPASTMNWKVYRNDKYRLELRHPKNWTVDEVAGAPVFFLKSNNFKPVLLGYDAENKALFSRGEIRTDIFDNPKNLSIKDKYLENDDITRLYFVDEKKRYQETKINNYDAVIFEPFSENNPNWKIDVKHKIVILKLKNKILSLDYIYTGSSDEEVMNILPEVANSVSLLR